MIDEEGLDGMMKNDTEFLHNNDPLTPPPSARTRSEGRPGLPAPFDAD